jgi:hypothetical protein
MDKQDKDGLLTLALIVGGAFVVDQVFRSLLSHVKPSTTTPVKPSTATPVKTARAETPVQQPVVQTPRPAGAIELGGKQHWINENAIIKGFGFGWSNPFGR